MTIKCSWRVEAKTAPANSVLPPGRQSEQRRLLYLGLGYKALREPIAKL
jgi:hypothetical protein